MNNKKKLFRWIKIIVLVYCLIGIALFYLQDYIFFHPKPLPATHIFQFNISFKELTIPYSANSKMNIVQFKTKDSIPKGVVLYFHGNRQNIERYARFAPEFTRNGYEVWMIDYPGYGKSTGPFTEQKLYEWALVFYKLARARFSPDSIILYGKSMGTGIATQLASIRDCKHLILETPYYSFPSLAGNYLPVYPLDRMIRFKVPTFEYIQKVTAPITILHGSDDGVIPIRNAKRLIPYLKTGDQFVIIEEGSHNDLSKYPLFLQKLDLILK